jgi:hypothetical protein
VAVHNYGVIRIKGEQLERPANIRSSNTGGRMSIKTRPN